MSRGFMGSSPVGHLILFKEVYYAKGETQNARREVAVL